MRPAGTGSPVRAWRTPMAPRSTSMPRPASSTTHRRSSARTTRTGACGPTTASSPPDSPTRPRPVSPAHCGSSSRTDTCAMRLPTTTSTTRRRRSTRSTTPLWPSAAGISAVASVPTAWENARYIQAAQPRSTRLWAGALYRRVTTPMVALWVCACPGGADRSRAFVVGRSVPGRIRRSWVSTVWLSIVCLVRRTRVLAVVPRSCRLGRWVPHLPTTRPPSRPRLSVCQWWRVWAMRVRAAAAMRVKAVQPIAVASRPLR